jgi:hypothetical protein
MAATAPAGLRVQAFLKKQALWEPMKAKLVNSMSPGDLIYEIKLSRNRKDLGSKFPGVKNFIAALEVRFALCTSSSLVKLVPHAGFDGSIR